MWKKIGLKMLINHGDSTKCRVEGGDDGVGVVRGGILNFVYFVYLPHLSSISTSITVILKWCVLLALGTIYTILDYFTCDRNR
jgi:hypothetical protein